MQPLFLQGSAGPLFANYYAAEQATASVLICPPFGDELNKSRRMLALQARELQASGCAVLQLDLYGCGDSTGGHDEARWQQWQQDLVAAWRWLLEKTGKPPILLGLRLGGLMALELSALVATPKLLLWQPVLNGKQFIQQFLRLRLAASAFAGSSETAADLRGVWEGGEVLEIAGYGLHPELAAEIEAARAPDEITVPLAWFQLASSADKALPGAQQKKLDSWGDSATLQTVVGEQFWQTPEIAEVPALIAATSHSVKRCEH